VVRRVVLAAAAIAMVVVVAAVLWGRGRGDGLPDVTLQEGDDLRLEVSNASDVDTVDIVVMLENDVAFAGHVDNDDPPRVVRLALPPQSPVRPNFRLLGANVTTPDVGYSSGLPIDPAPIPGYATVTFAGGPLDDVRTRLRFTWLPAG
jgi:hypothetical protein